MPIYKCRSYAKINLFLDILSKEESGYHKLKMIMQSVSLYDDLIFEPIQRRRIELESNVPEINTNNIIHKAFEIYSDYFNEKMPNGFKVTINKRIPLGAGLAGGSSNAAVAVGVFKKHFNLKIPKKILLELNHKIGSDVNFCYVGGTKQVEGVGNVIKSLPKREAHVLLVYPSIHIASSEAYRLWDLRSTNNKTAEISESGLYNAFEKVMLPMYPEIEKIKEDFSEAGATDVLMTGSGSTVFGVFSNKLMCENGYKILIKKYKNIYNVRYISKGFSINQYS
ncbi:MAG: 4-(cytidine 5'-diphospho)-2-C-methyl-D-erythritol kinase [Candidatus Margulisbacteria bacterium GWF2_35_9]|nr:MAG: 4-(cytidine 5'-diphospho)-2-C-methyl-D-erythritol kinase [Candidatus Margulisbacteria bacterium GWF2_35_9]